MSGSTIAVEARGQTRPVVRRNVWRWAQMHPYVIVAVLAIGFRLALVATSGWFEDFALDDGTYHQMATEMAAGDISRWDDFTYSLFWRTATFLGPITLIYKIFGPEIVAGQIFVAFVGAAVAIVGLRLAMEFLSIRWALLVGFILALLPSQAFWSAQLMKDASVWLVLSGLALAIAIGNRSTGHRLVMAGLGVGLLLCALAFLREHTLVVAAWATMIASMFGLRHARFARIGGAIALGVTIPWAVAAIGPAGVDLVTNAGSLQEIRFKMAQGANTAVVDTTPGGTEAELNEIINRIAELRAQPEDSGSTDAEATRAEISKLLAEQARIQAPAPGTQLSEGETALEPNVAHLPRGVSVMLVEPFPLPFSGSPSLRMARLESLLWYPLLAVGAIGLWNVRPYLRQMSFPLVAGGGILIMYALSEGNVGTAHRHRGEFVWVVVLLAAIGLRHIFAHRRGISPEDA